MKMTNRRHNVQKAMMHLQKAKMHFGGFQSSGMERLNHYAIIRYSEQLGPEDDDKPSLFEFDVYATEEQNSTKPHLDKEDFFNDGFNQQRIGTLSIEYTILGNDYNGGEDEHCIDLTFRYDDGHTLAASTWEILQHFKPHQPLDRNERTVSISLVKDAAAQLACQHHQCTVGFRNVDLYLKKTVHV